LLAANYSLVDLGEGSAMDINLSGKVVGNNGAVGWYYDGTTRKDLVFDGHYSNMPPEVIFKGLKAGSANAINDAGQITGYYKFPGPTTTPYRYDGVSLATFFNTGTTGLGINSAGDVVGVGLRVTGTVETALPGLGSGTSINTAGVAVGSVSPDGTEIAASFGANEFAVLDLAGLGLPTPPRGGSYASRATSVNASGAIVGYVNLVSGSPFHSGWGFLYSNGSATSLAGLGGQVVAANDISDNGLIVGSSTTADGATHAVIFEGGTATDLNLQITSGGDGWTLTDAFAVNNAGKIVGQGIKNGQVRAFLLSPASNEVPPQISAQPQGVTLFAGKSFQLSVTPSGTSPFTYQWKHAGTNVPNAKASTYAVSSAGANDDGVYTVIVSNAFGSKESNEARVSVRLAAVLSIARYAGILLEGPEGKSYEIQAVERAEDTNWQTLATVPVAQSPYFWLDTTSNQHPNRIYRAVSVSP
jgi:probable HAF family extracellular repeat protein